MSCAVYDVENANRIGSDPVEYKVGIESAHRKHSHGVYIRIRRWICDATLRVCGDLVEGFRYSFENPFSRGRVVMGNVVIDTRQVILNDCWMPFYPHAPVRLDAAFRTLSFQSASKGANGPPSRSISTRSSDSPAQSDSTKFSRYSSLDAAPDAFTRSASVASSTSGKWMVTVDII